MTNRHAPVRDWATDFDFHGHRLKAGDWLLLPFPAANRDPAVFSDPRRIDLGRAALRHAAFGLGIHRCLGEHLARMELRVALEEWLARYPDFELADPRRRHLVRRPDPRPAHAAGQHLPGRGPAPLAICKR